jgi:hypothetical protein
MCWACDDNLSSINNMVFNFVSFDAFIPVVYFSFQCLSPFIQLYNFGDKGQPCLTPCFITLSSVVLMLISILTVLFV